MNCSYRKPKLTSHQLITKMKNEKGIKFSIISEAEAEEYLFNINNYLRTASYRKNYQKHQKGENEGKYIDLEFAYLKELSTLDFHFRSLVSSMCIDIEHDLKVKILLEIELDPKQDGYKIVELFLDKNQNILNKIAMTSTNSFTSDLITKYFKLGTKLNEITGRPENIIIEYKDCPIWVLFELITFGDLVKFYNFYKENFSTTISFSKPILKLVKNLRNASVHNNCILSNLERKTSFAPEEIIKKIASFKTISKDTRKKMLSCRPILEFISMLYAFDILVSPNIKKKRIESLKKLFFSRMRRNKNYFKNNQLIKSSYIFACNAIQGFFFKNI